MEVLLPFLILGYVKPRADRLNILGLYTVVLGLVILVVAVVRLRFRFVTASSSANLNLGMSDTMTVEGVS
jgi:hypothetical protein